MAPACEVAIRGNSQVAHAAAWAGWSGVMQELCPGGGAPVPFRHSTFGLAPEPPRCGGALNVNTPMSDFLA
jgi:hypothetical protein